jgi:hypothetical protein
MRNLWILSLLLSSFGSLATQAADCPADVASLLARAGNANADGGATSPFIRGLRFEDYEDRGEMAGIYNQVRLLEFDRDVRPIEKLHTLKALFDAKDPSLRAVGRFKRITDDGEAVDVFEYKVSNTKILQLRLPFNDDGIEVNTNWVSTAFNDQPLQQAYPYEHRGRSVLLFGHNAMMARIGADEASVREMIDQSLDRMPAPASLDEILENPKKFRNALFNLQLDSEANELILGLLRKLDAIDDTTLDAWKRNRALADAEYVEINLRWLHAQKWPSAADVERLGTIEARSGNQVVFGDGDLTIELLSERPYRLYLKESEDIEYVIEKSSRGARELKIYLGASVVRRGSNVGSVRRAKGVVTMKADGSIQTEGVVDPYQVGRLAFPPELIRARLEE